MAGDEIQREMDEGRAQLADAVEAIAEAVSPAAKKTPAKSKAKRVVTDDLPEGAAEVAEVEPEAPQAPAPVPQDDLPEGAAAWSSGSSSGYVTLPPEPRSKKLPVAAAVGAGVVLLLLLRRRRHRR